MGNLANGEMGDLARKIDVLIFLELDSRCPSMAEKIGELSEAGLNAGEIGRILSNPSNYVTATLSQGKKRKGAAGR